MPQAPGSRLHAVVLGLKAFMNEIVSFWVLGQSDALGGGVGKRASGHQTDRHRLPSCATMLFQHVLLLLLEI